MKVYTEEEIKKLFKSFNEFLEQNEVYDPFLHEKIYNPVPIEVELIAKEIKPNVQ
jgi:hypothetical protein